MNLTALWDKYKGAVADAVTVFVSALAVGWIDGGLSFRDAIVAASVAAGKVLISALNPASTSYGIGSQKGSQSP
jgi:hypothetical protein